MLSSFSIIGNNNNCCRRDIIHPLICVSKQMEVPPHRAVSREFLGTPFFEMVIFPFFLPGGEKIKSFNTSDPLKSYGVESNTQH